ncbi:MAG: YihY/virulence factor BrkB family protein [bacterium]
MTVTKFWQVLNERRRAVEAFLRRGLWEEARPSHVKPWIQASLRFLILVAREFRRDDCTTKSSALTYITLLSLVPIVTVMFVAFRGLNVDRIGDDQIHQVFASLQLSEIVPSEDVKKVVADIRNKVEEIDFKALGMVGLLGLIFTAVMAIGSVEQAFNRIWGVGRGRSVWRRFSDYLSVLIVGPLLIFLALTFSAGLVQNEVRIAFGIVDVITAGLAERLLSLSRPLIISALAFSFVYSFLPNIRVPFHCALFGGVSAGFLWQISQWGYVKFQVGVAKYSALYGTLAALPIFLLWVYLSWVILLLGAEAAFCFQNYRRLSREFLDVDLSVEDRESIGIWMAARVTESFAKNVHRWTLARFSDALHLRDSVTATVLAPLLTDGILSVLADEEGAIVPGHDPATIRLSDVLNAIHNAGDELSKSAADCLFQRVVSRKDLLRRFGVERADLSLTEFLQLGRTGTEIPTTGVSAPDLP